MFLYQRNNVQGILVSLWKFWERLIKNRIPIFWSTFQRGKGDKVVELYRRYWTRIKHLLSIHIAFCSDLFGSLTCTFYESGFSKLCVVKRKSLNFQEHSLIKEAEFQLIYILEDKKKNDKASSKASPKNGRAYRVWLIRNFGCTHQRKTGQDTVRKSTQHPVK